jgi:hypothetical protein
MADNQSTIMHFFGKNSNSTSMCTPPDPIDKILGLPLTGQKENVSVNGSVKEHQLSKHGKKRGLYSNFDSGLKATIRRYAAENRNAKAIRCFGKQGIEIKESTVRRFKEAYLLKLKQTKGDKSKVKQLEAKARGRPLMLGEEIDSEVRKYVQQLRFVAQLKKFFRSFTKYFFNSQLGLLEAL